jgi:DNA-binding PadR family transcriptional regulator
MAIEKSESRAAPEPGISATTAALLGQLAWRDQTPYELVKAMGANVRFFWPRAESHVYREVKRLVELGLATAERGSTGRRARTVYGITAAGRGALREWLASAPGGVALEHEPLLRVFIASNGTRADLLESVRAARAQAEAMLAIGDDLAERYATRTHEFQQEVHIRALSFDYLYSWAKLTVEWADRTEAEVSRWSDVKLAPAKERRAIRAISALVARVG